MKVCYSFQAEVYTILACVYEIQTIARPEKYVSICYDRGLSGCQNNVSTGTTVPNGVE